MGPGRLGTTTDAPGHVHLPVCQPRLFPLDQAVRQSNNASRAAAASALSAQIGITNSTRFADHPAKSHFTVFQMVCYLVARGSPK